MVHSVPGPCDPEDLVDGIIFAATYLGCTHLLSERTPTKTARMQQAQEAMSRVRVRANHRLAGAVLAEQITVWYLEVSYKVNTVFPSQPFLVQEKEFKFFPGEYV